mmetsp:Transcript_31911/g.95310  ORF Transcript_31911/g.95310 Transcript_31911/m.95310 type:complete len:300 (-) Transcript_31911:218-1117(-)
MQSCETRVAKPHRATPPASRATSLTARAHPRTLGGGRRPGRRTADGGRLASCAPPHLPAAVHSARSERHAAELRAGWHWVLARRGAHGTGLRGRRPTRHGLSPSFVSPPLYVPRRRGEESTLMKVNRFTLHTKLSRGHTPGQQLQQRASFRSTARGHRDPQRPERAGERGEAAGAAQTQRRRRPAPRTRPSRRCGRKSLPSPKRRRSCGKGNKKMRKSYFRSLPPFHACCPECTTIPCKLPMSRLRSIALVSASTSITSVSTADTSGTKSMRRSRSSSCSFSEMPRTGPRWIRFIRCVA